MAIVNYANRIYKTVVPAIDRVMAKRVLREVKGSQDITTTALDAVISADRDWQVDSISLEFSGAAARDYSISVLNGRKVVANYNDYLWFQTQNTMGQRIILDEGFYTGTELATELQTQLDANASFSALGLTFTVTYTEATGLFAITPSAGNLRYLNVNQAKTLRTRDSIAGHLFGLTEDTAYIPAVSTDAPVFGLNTETDIISETADVDLNRYVDDLHILSIDQAIKLASSSGVAIRIDYTVIYEEIV